MDENEDLTTCTVVTCDDKPTWLGYLTAGGETKWAKRVGYCDEHVRLIEKTSKMQGLTLDVTRIGEEA